MPDETATEGVAASSTRAVRRDVARNRALLLAAADEVFKERGAEATLDDIARHAGVGVATAYRHFENKQALLQALVEERLCQAEVTLDEAEAIEDPRLALEHFLVNICQFQAADRGMREAMSGNDEYKSSELRKRMLPRVVALVDQAHEAQVLRPEFVASDIGPLLWMIGQVSDHTASISPDLWRRYLSFFLDGVIATGEPRHEIDIDALSIEEATNVVIPPTSAVLRSLNRSN